MGNQCCSRGIYTEHQFNLIYQKRFQSNIPSTDLSTGYHDPYRVECGPKRVVFWKVQQIIADKSVYDMLCIIKKVYEEEKGADSLFSTENLVSFFSINLPMITSKLIVESIIELLNIPHSKENLLSRLNLLTNWLKDAKLLNKNSDTQNKNQKDLLNNNQNIDNHRMRKYDEYYMSDSHTYEGTIKINSMNNYKSKIPAIEEAVVRVQDDIQIQQHLVASLKEEMEHSQLHQQLEQNEADQLQSEQLQMGYYQLEQVSKRPVFESWRVFDAQTGNMNYYKKYNIRQFSKMASLGYQKESKVFSLFQNLSLSPCTQLINKDPSKGRIVYEGGIATIWEMHQEMHGKLIRWSENDLMYLVLELTQFVFKLKKMEIYHNNITPQNIVLLQTAKSKYQVKLVNFENSSIIPIFTLPQKVKPQQKLDLFSQQQQDYLPSSQQLYNQQLKNQQQYGYQLQNQRFNYHINNSQEYYFAKQQQKLLDDQIIKNKTQQYYDLSLQYKGHPDLLETQLYQIGKTILNLMISPEIQPLAFRLRKNNPLIADEVLKYSMKEYPNLVPIVHLLLNCSHFTRTIHNFIYNNPQQKIDHEIEIEKLFVKMREEIKNGVRPNFIYDKQGVVQAICNRRADMGAWEEEMQIEAFKREIRFIFSMEEFERGCDLCNYLLSFIPQNKYYNKMFETIYSTQQQLQQCSMDLSPIFSGQNGSQIKQQTIASQLTTSSTLNTQTNIVGGLMLFRWTKRNKKNQLKKDEKRYGNIQHEFYSKCEMLCKWYFQKSQTPDIVYTYLHSKQQLSQYFYQIKQYALAAEVQIALLNEAKNILPNDFDTIAIYQIFLANILFEKESFQEAERNVTQGLGLLNRVHPDGTHIEIAKGLLILSKIRFKLNDNKQAIQAATLASVIASQASPNTLDLAEIAEGSADIKIEADECNRAVSEMELACRIRCSCYNSIELSEFVDNDLLKLGYLQSCNKQYPLAQSSYKELLRNAINRIHNTDKNNVDQIKKLQELIAQTHSLIGCQLEHINQLDKALSHHNKSLQIRLHIYGSSHLDVANSYENISVVQIRRQQFQEALLSIESSLNIRQSLVPDSLQTAQSWNSMGIALEALGNYERSIACHESALKIKVALYGEKSNSIATTYNNLALTYQKANQLEKALECSQKALDIRKEIISNNNNLNSQQQQNSELIPILYNMINIHNDLGNYVQAEQIQEQLNTIQNLLLNKQVFQEIAQSFQEELLFKSSHPNGSLLALSKQKNSLMQKPFMGNNNNMSMNNNNQMGPTVIHNNIDMNNQMIPNALVLNNNLSQLNNSNFNINNNSNFNINNSNFNINNNNNINLNLNSNASFGITPYLNQTVIQDPSLNGQFYPVH